MMSKTKRWIACLVAVVLVMATVSAVMEDGQYISNVKDSGDRFRLALDVDATGGESGFVLVGETLELTANEDYEPTWSCNETTIVEIPTGAAHSIKVKALQVGTATITARVQNQTKSYTVKVIDAGTYEEPQAEAAAPETEADPEADSEKKDDETQQAPVTKTKMVIVINGGTFVTTYTGEDQSFGEFNATSASDDFDREKIVVTDDHTVTEKNCGYYFMGLKAENFSYNDENVDAIFAVNDGYMKIVPAQATVTAEDKTKMAGEEDPVLTAKVEGLVGEDTEDLIKYTLTRWHGDEPGAYVIEAEGEPAQGNYKVAFVPGKLTITETLQAMDITDHSSVSYFNENNQTVEPANMDPNQQNRMQIDVTGLPMDNVTAQTALTLNIPEYIQVNASSVSGADVTANADEANHQIVFNYNGEAKNAFSAIIPIELNAPATRNDVSGTWVLAVKNKSSKLIVVQPTEKVIDGANRLTAVEGTLYNNAIYRPGTDLPEWKVTRYTGDWYSISCGGRYLNYGSNGGNISLSANPQYFLYTTVPTGDQFMAVGKDGSKYYLNNKSNNAGKGIQASTYDDQCVVLYRKMKSAGNEVLVSFSTNGGSASGGLDPVLVPKGTSITLPGYSGTKNGSVFIGWATKENLKINEYVRVYQPGEAVNVDQETAFYAAWSSKNPERAQFGIRMSGDIPDEPAQYDTSAYSKEHVYLDNTVITGKWVVDTNAAGQAVEGNHVVNAVTANLKQLPTDDEIKITYPNYDPATMYVHWYVLKYAGGMWKVDGVILSRSYKADVRYDANVPTESKSLIKNIPASYKADDGTGITIGTGADGKKMNLPAYPEHDFEGWNTMADGSGQNYEPGAAYTVNGSVTFYAQWIVSGQEGPMSISISSDWPEGELGYVGAQITMTAELTGFEGKTYSLQWQYSMDGENWMDVPDANAISYTYILDETTTQYVWRIVAKNIMTQE